MVLAATIPRQRQNRPMTFPTHSKEKGKTTSSVGEREGVVVCCNSL